MVIESLEKWNEVSDILRRMGYRVFVMQFSAESPEGFHANFVGPGAPTVEIITHDAAVAASIIDYNHGR